MKFIFHLFGFGTIGGVVGVSGITIIETLFICIVVVFFSFFFFSYILGTISKAIKFPQNKRGRKTKKRGWAA